jgi:hypothetical protein
MDLLGERFMPGVTAGIIAIVVALIFLLPNSLHRNEASETAARCDRKKLEAKSKPFSLWSLPLLFFVVIPSSILVSYVFFKIVNYAIDCYWTHLLPDIVILHSFGNFFVLPSVFIGILSFLVIFISIQRLILKKRFAAWKDYNNSFIFSTFSHFFLVIVFVLATFLIANYYRYVSRDAFVVHDFCAVFEIRHSFGDIQSITTSTFVEQGREYPVYSIRFKDNTLWVSQWKIKNINPRDIQLDGELIEYCSEHSGVPIQKI